MPALHWHTYNTRAAKFLPLLTPLLIKVSTRNYLIYIQAHCSIAAITRWDKAHTKYQKHCIKLNV